MPPKIIVSYDGTENDRDALLLGRILAGAGADISLAYVRHTHEADQSRERLEQSEAEQLLGRGGELLGDPKVERHVVQAPSTGEGLRTLAQEQGADVVVFGSDWHTPPGHVGPLQSAQSLLEGGPVAVAIAAAELRNRSNPNAASVAVADDGDPAARQTADSLAAGLGATLTESGHADVLVIGSRPEADKGWVLLSARSQYLVETAESHVLVLPRGRQVAFGRGADVSPTTAPSSPYVTA